MKTTDDYYAKIRYWASRPEVPKLPKATGWPPFRAKKFNTYEGMNDWKRNTSWR
jgi:hypothetical protein